MFQLIAPENQLAVQFLLVTVVIILELLIIWMDDVTLVQGQVSLMLLLVKMII